MEISAVARSSALSGMQLPLGLVGTVYIYAVIERSASCASADCLSQCMQSFSRSRQTQKAHANVHHSSVQPVSCDGLPDIHVTDPASYQVAHGTWHTAFTCGRQLATSCTIVHAKLHDRGTALRDVSWQRSSRRFLTLPLPKQLPVYPEGLPPSP